MVLNKSSWTVAYKYCKRMQKIGMGEIAYLDKDSRSYKIEDLSFIQSKFINFCHKAVFIVFNDFIALKMGVFNTLTRVY